MLGGELGKGGGEEVPGARSSKVDQYTGTGTGTAQHHPSRFSQSLGFRAAFILNTMI